MNDSTNDADDRATDTTLEKIVGDRIDARKIGGTQMATILLCMVLATLDGYDVAAMGLAVPLIARDWHVSPGAFGGALAALMIGLGTGNVLLGWLGDRFGRKPVILASTCAIGLCSLATITADNVIVMTIWRFLLGMAFGATFPNIYALVGDVVPSRQRSFCMTLLTTSTSIGAIAGGLAAPLLSKKFGWEGIFLAGGLLPLALVPILFLVLRESPKVLAVRARMRELIVVLASFGIDSSGLPDIGGRAPVRAGRPLDLVRNGLWLISVLYVLAWSLSGVVYYLLANWLPSLLTMEGWPTSSAQRSISLVYGGAMAGSLAISWAMDRSERFGMLFPAGASALGAVLFGVAGYWITSSIFSGLLVGLGLTVSAVQCVMPTLAARLYPPRLLATSISWISAFARVGAIGGPLLGGWMILSGWQAPAILAALSIVPAICAVILGALALTGYRRATDRSSSGAEGASGWSPPLEARA
jgi:AAHS family 4-hydroxybenzoate transporter-like MFS transporter